MHAVGNESAKLACKRIVQMPFKQPSYEKHICIYLLTASFTPLAEAPHPRNSRKLLSTAHSRSSAEKELIPNIEYSKAYARGVSTQYIYYLIQAHTHTHTHTFKYIVGQK